MTLEQPQIKQGVNSIPERFPPIPREPNEVLGIQPNASPEQIMGAHREMTKRYHPDLYERDPPTKKLAQKWLVELNKAREAMLHPEIAAAERARRQELDRRLNDTSNQAQDLKHTNPAKESSVNQEWLSSRIVQEIHYSEYTLLKEAFNPEGSVPNQIEIRNLNTKILELKNQLLSIVGRQEYDHRMTLLNEQLKDTKKTLISNGLSRLEDRIKNLKNFEIDPILNSLGELPSVEKPDIIDRCIEFLINLGEDRKRKQEDESRLRTILSKKLAELDALEKRKIELEKLLTSATN